MSLMIILIMIVKFHWASHKQEWEITRSLCSM